MNNGDRVGDSVALGSGRNALVVDDNLANRMVLSHMLRNFGFGVAEAADGFAAMEAAEVGKDGRPFDVIMMDCRMHGMDGYDTTRFIRAREKDLGRPSAPILAVTANDDAQAKAEALSAGMDGFLTKPLNASALRDSLAQALNVRISETARPHNPQSHLSRRAQELRAIGGDGLLREVYAAFLDDARVRMRALMTALAHADAIGLGEQAHALKGSSLQVGAAEVADAARSLEKLGKEGTVVGASALVRTIHKAIAALENEVAA